MSILNVSIDRDRALVAVDTLCQTGQGPRETLKLYPLPHIGAVIAGRGQLAFLLQIHLEVILHCATFDDLVERTIEALPPLFARLRAQPNAAAFGMGDGSDVQELVLVGWSPQAQAMQGWRWSQSDPRLGFTREEIAPWLVSPALEPVGDLSTATGMLHLARRQVTRWRPSAPGGALGGRLLLAELRRGALMVRDVGGLPYAGCRQPCRQGASSRSSAPRPAM